MQRPNSRSDHHYSPPWPGEADCVVKHGEWIEGVLQDIKYEYGAKLRANGTRNLVDAISGLKVRSEISPISDLKVCPKVLEARAQHQFAAGHAAPAGTKFEHGAR